MNNEEILKINSLKQETEKIENEIDEIRKIITRYKNSFKYQESIEALSRIHEYWRRQYDRKKKIEQEIETITKKLGENCKHHILIQYPSKYECPICKMKYYSYNLSPTTKYVISDFNYNEENSNVEKLVLSSIDEQTAEDKILNHFDDLQYSQNVRIRRITK